MGFVLHDTSTFCCSSAAFTARAHDVLHVPHVVPDVHREPRDHASEHAHESPWIMTLPLIVLAIFSVGVAWGWPLWDPHASQVRASARTGRPGTAHGLAFDDHAAGWVAWWCQRSALALPFTCTAAQVDPGGDSRQGRCSVPVLCEKWHFDEVYDAMFVRPAVALGYGTARFDKALCAARSGRDCRSSDQRDEPGRCFDALGSALSRLVKFVGTIWSDSKIHNGADVGGRCACGRAARGLLHGRLTRHPT